MRRLWLVWCVLAGCKGANGVLIEIPAEHVELFVAKTPIPCDGNGSCAITPPSMLNASQRAYPAQGWYIDEQLFAADSTSTETVIQIEADPTLPDATQEISALLVVAYQADDHLQPTGFTMLTGVDVSKTEQRTIKIDALTPYAPIATTAGQGLEVWHKHDPTAAGCAVVRHADGSVDFFGPTSDVDCDDAARECEPFVYDGSTPADGTRADVRFHGHEAVSDRRTRVRR